MQKEYKNENPTRRSKIVTKGRKSKNTVTEFELIDVGKNLQKSVKPWEWKYAFTGRESIEIGTLMEIEKREQNPDHISKLHPPPYFHIYCHSLQHQRGKMEATSHFQSMIQRERETQIRCDGC